MIYVFSLLIFMGIFVYKPNVICLLAILFLSYLSFISINIPDMSNYLFIYSHIQPYELMGEGYGWYLINDLGRQHNLSFLQLKMILVIVSLTLLFLAIKYFNGKNKNFIWGLYLIYPALLDVIQIRFMLAISISIFALIFLFKNKWWSIIIYVCLIGLAMQIHSSCAFYFSFLAIPFFKKYKKISTSVIAAGVLILIIFKDKLAEYVSSFASDRQGLYFENGTTTRTFLLIICILVLFYFVAKALNDEVNKNLFFNERQRRLLEFNYDINLLMLLTIPLSLISSEFLRVQRLAWIIMYMSLNLYQINNQKILVSNIEINSKFLGWVLAMIGFCFLIVYMSPEVVPSFFY